MIAAVPAPEPLGMTLGIDDAALLVIRRGVRITAAITPAWSA